MLDKRSFKKFYNIKVVKNLEIMAPNTCIRGCCTSSSIPLHLPPSSYYLLSLIAKGAGSVVYEGILDGNKVAVKEPVLSTTEDINKFHKELQLLCELDHPGIATLIAAHAKPPNYLFFFKFYESLNLAQKLHLEEWTTSINHAVMIIIQLGIVKILFYLEYSLSNIMIISTSFLIRSTYGLESLETRAMESCDLHQRAWALTLPYVRLNGEPPRIFQKSADEGRKETAKSEHSSSSALPSSQEALEDVARKLRSQIMLKLANRGISAASHPDVVISVKGQKVVAFLIYSFSAFLWSSFSCSLLNKV